MHEKKILKNKIKIKHNTTNLQKRGTAGNIA
jgi:hypothetical protein